MTAGAVPALSVVTPAYNEADNLPLFYPRLVAALAGLADRDGGWEWIVVDDGSRDGTGDVVARLAALDARVRGVRLPENAGSHPAIRRGLAESRGAAVLVLAADLQDPPELCAELLTRWRQGARVVWAVRRRRDGEGRLRRFLGARGLPAGGTGFCLLDRDVVETICRRARPPVDVFAAVGGLDARSAAVPYDRSPRRHGRSGWTWRKKMLFALRSLAGAR